ncbi:MAG: hypothetical protein ACO3CD_05630 [Candidatus Nanopelagicaceae bacterium]
MDRDKLKLIVKNLELLVDSLKSEVYSDLKSYTTRSNPGQDLSYSDNDDDGYPD